VRAFILVGLLAGCRPCAAVWECRAGEVSADAEVFPDGRLHAVFDGGEGGSQLATLPYGQRWTCARGKLHFLDVPCKRVRPWRLAHWLRVVLTRDYDDY
jgi:hypothetical protein